MKKQFENIDDLFIAKINNLDDTDVEINEHLIWKSIENQLDRKKSVRILWWKYAAAACVFLLLSLGYFQYNSTTDLVKKIPEKAPENVAQNNTLINNHSIQKETQNIDNQLLVNKKSDLRITQNKTPQHTLIPKNLTPNSNNLLILEPLHSIHIQKTEFAFSPTNIKPIEVVLPRKLRVMHIEDFQVQPMEKITQPKTFYVFFNKEFNIDNQLQTVSIAHPNNIN